MAAVGCLHLLPVAFVCPEVKPRFHLKILSLCTEICVSWIFFSLLGAFRKILQAALSMKSYPFVSPCPSSVPAHKDNGCCCWTTSSQCPREERGGKSCEPCLKSVGQGFVWIFYIPIPLAWSLVFPLIQHFGSGFWFWIFYDAS